MSERKCSHCGVENDVTRVYCVECGTRLPEPSPDNGAPTRSPVGKPAPALVGNAAPPLAGNAAPPLPQPVRRKPPGKVNAPKAPGLGALVFKMLVSTALFAAVLAAAIQMEREPDGIPKAVGPNAASAQETLSTLQQMAASKKPISWLVNQQAVNEFLATTIQMEPAAIATYGLGAEFQRAFVRFEAGSLDLGLEQKFLTRSVYFLLKVEAESGGDGLQAKFVGGSIGRLPVHPKLLPLFLRLFQSSITALQPTLELVQKASSAAIQPEDVKLQWAGSNAPSS